MIVNFMCAFFYFSQAMRFLNHVCILMNINVSVDEVSQLDAGAMLAYETLNANIVGDMFNRGSYFNTAGFRMYYLSFPVIAWIGGGYFMIAATIVIIIVLRIMDFNVKGKPIKSNSNANIIELSDTSKDVD